MLSRSLRLVHSRPHAGRVAGASPTPPWANPGRRPTHDPPLRDADQGARPVARGGVRDALGVRQLVGGKERPDGRGEGTLAHALLPCVPALTPTLARLAAAAQGAADARGGGGAQRDGGGPDPGDLRQEGEGAGERDRPPAARECVATAPPTAPAPCSHTRLSAHTPACLRSAPGDGGALQRERRRTRTRPPHSHSPTYPLPPSLAPNAIPLLAQFLSK